MPDRVVSVSGTERGHDTRPGEREQLVRRYREALERILAADGGEPWCRDFALCDHVGCRVSAKHIEIARAALDLEAAVWPLREEWEARDVSR